MILFLPLCLSNTIVHEILRYVPVVSLILLKGYKNEDLFVLCETKSHLIFKELTL